MVESHSFPVRMQTKAKANQRAFCHSGNGCFWGQAALVQANVSRVPAAVTRTPHALERMNILEVNPASLHRDTPTLHGRLAGWRSPPSHEDAGQYPNDPSTWKPSAQLGLETVAMCGEGFSLKH